VNVIELPHALHQLRCSGMAAGLEARLLEAQAEKLPAVDFVARLVQDELVRRQDRLLARRLQQAGFRDVGKRLDTFDFDFNKKMNRALVFDLATARARARVTSRRPSALPSFSKAIGCSTGRRMSCSRTSDAQLAGTRKATLAQFTTVPLLIID
jgi:hypothetical protein